MNNRLIPKNRWRKWILLISCILLTLILSEGVLRFCGYKTLRYLFRPNEQTMYIYHPVLGWQSKEGSYHIPPYGPADSDIDYTFLANGLRKTYQAQANRQDNRSKLILIGCSFTLGWDVSDNQTYAWKLQEKFSEVEVLNYGAAGYGTYQSLLTLESILPTLSAPAIVLYGFFDHHEDRNVATADWMFALRRGSQRGHIFVPYVSMGSEGHVIRHKPEAYPSFPLGENLVLLSLAKRAYVNCKAYNRTLHKRELTEKLLLEMKEICDSYQVPFLMVYLNGKQESKDHYAKFTENNHITMIDCYFPLTAERRVRGDGHPNEIHHTSWADCISIAISCSINQINSNR